MDEDEDHERMYQLSCVTCVIDVFIVVDEDDDIAGKFVHGCRSALVIV